MNNLEYLCATNKDQIATMISGECENCKMLDDCREHDGIFCSKKWLLSDSGKFLLDWNEFRNGNVAVYCGDKNDKADFIKAAKIAGIRIVLGIDYQKYDYYFVSTPLYGCFLDCCYKEYVDAHGLRVAEYNGVGQ